MSPEQVDVAPKRPGEDAIHQALHKLEVRIPDLKVGGCHCNLITQVVLDALAPTMEQLHGELAREQRYHTQALEERDRAADAANRLAYAIAPVEAIGEHSGDNDPWANALEAIAQRRPLGPAPSCGHTRGITIGGRCAECTAVPEMPEMPETQPVRHFSPGYTGEVPNHLGAFETCPMPVCVTSRKQHEAAADLQDLTYQILNASNEKDGQ